MTGPSTVPVGVAVQPRARRSSRSSSAVGRWSQTETALTKSFASAADVAAAYPQYSDAIVQAARTSFMQGDDWAYVAGIVAVLVGAALIGGLFPGRDRERQMLAEYAAQDRVAATSA